MEEKYYSGFKVQTDFEWSFLLDLTIEKANAVEFNIFFKDYYKENKLQPILKYQIFTDVRMNKIHSDGKCIRFNLSTEVINFVKSKSYDSWKNYCLGDISFLINEKEIMATISHHEEIILLLTPTQKEELQKLGFDFWCEWKPF
jgi:hypothetical protein